MAETMYVVHIVCTREEGGRPLDYSSLKIAHKQLIDNAALITGPPYEELFWQRSLRDTSFFKCVARGNSRAVASKSSIPIIIIMYSTSVGSTLYVTV